MRRILFLFLILNVLAVPFLFSQTVEIVDIKGKVLVKQDQDYSWSEPWLHMILTKNAQIKTAKLSECTLAFDEERKNIVTIKEDSQVTIESIKPAEVFLPKGRVFSLVEEIDTFEKFQIRTPVAIAGARGTGWSTDSGDQGTQVKCFEDVTYVQGLDEQGNTTGEEDLSGGFGIGVGPGGDLGDLFQLTDKDFDEWDGFKDNAEDQRRDYDEGKEGANSGTEDIEKDFSIDDLRDEQKDDFREEAFEDFRQEKDEDRQEDNRGSGGEEQGGYKLEMQ